MNASANWLKRLTDKTLPAVVRVVAANKLAGSDVRANFCGIAIDETDDPAVRCAVIEQMPAWGHYMAVNFLLQSIPERSSPGCR